jgi:hypothetical protein
MTHLKVLKLLNSLTFAKRILDELEEYDDYSVIDLLELKYEKIYQQIPKN